MSDQTPKTHTPSELYDSVEVVAVMKRAYYTVLSGHAPFADELAALPAEAGIRRKAVHDVMKRFEHQLFTDEQITAALWETVSRPAEERALRFARKWRMPAQSHDEVIDAILLSFAIDPEVKAEAGLGEGPAPCLPLVPDGYLRSRAWRERPLIDLGVERPVTVSLSASYRPWERTPKQMRAHLLGEASRQIAEQLEPAEHAFEAAGYRQLHPQRLAPAMLAANARRTFERVVKGMTWDAIARGDGIERQSAIESVRRFATEIGIVLADSDLDA